MKLQSKVLLLALGAMFTGTALAAVGADEAKKLGGAELTAWGAEKAGNKDGTIPAYTGAVLKAPANYNPKTPGQHPDPFNEKPLFTITAQNMTQHAARLTEGQKALFKAYPDFRMDVYPSHRTATFPKYVLDNTAKNATACKAVDGGLRLEGCYGGFPFPVPKTGYEVMWNHLVAYETHAWVGNVSNWLIPPNGAPVMQAKTTCYEEAPFYDPARTSTNAPKDIYWRVRCDDTAPSRRVGQKIVLLDAIDQINVGRRAYQYIPGQRRVKLAPDLSYDTPNPFTGGGSTMDDAKGFVGAMDRFDFKLVGKQEKYILHNAYAMQDSKACPDEKIAASKRFPLPECLRWELHRVWVVEATLKPGFRHIYAKRAFYWDEDSFTAGQSEAYDAGGKLFRVILPMHFTLYETQGSATAGVTISLDMQTGIWAMNGYSGCGDDCGWTIAKPWGDNFFSPDALAGEGIR